MPEYDVVKVFVKSQTLGRLKTEVPQKLRLFSDGFGFNHNHHAAEDVKPIPVSGYNTGRLKNKH